MSIRQSVRCGRAELVVVGSSKAGFILAARKGKSLSRFGDVFSLQRDALSYGERKFGKLPIKARI